MLRLDGFLFRSGAPFIEREKRDAADFHQKVGQTLYLIRHIKQTPLCKRNFPLRLRHPRREISLSIHVIKKSLSLSKLTW